jgi:hypothetical protein
VDGVPDADNDGVALGPAAVLRAMMGLASVDAAYPSIASFLQFVVATGVAARAEVERMLTAGRHPVSLLADAWPLDLVLPAVVSGKVDGLTDPAPSGGQARPQTGFDALRTYRVRVAARTRLTIALRIFGSGRGADHTDVDVELRDQRADVLASSRGEGPTEAINHGVDPGTYVIVVRDGGNGNRASYELRVSASP